MPSMAAKLLVQNSIRPWLLTTISLCVSANDLILILCSGVGNTDRQFKSGGVDLSGPAAEVWQSVKLGDEQHQTMIYLVCS